MIRRHSSIIPQMSTTSTASEMALLRMNQQLFHPPCSNHISPPSSPHAGTSIPPSGAHFFTSFEPHCPISMDGTGFEHGVSPPPPTYSPPPLPQLCSRATPTTLSTTAQAPLPFIATATSPMPPSYFEEEHHKPVNYCKVIFKIWIVFISFAGFMYQAQDICTHYFSYRTVVYTNTEQDSLVDLPSLTFCLPTYFTKQSLEQLYDPFIKRNVEETAAFKNKTLLDAIKPVIYETYQVCVSIIFKKHFD